MRLFLRCAWICAALALFAESSRAGEYVVLSGVSADDPYDHAAKLLAQHHKTKHLLRFDPQQPDTALDALRKIGPDNVAIVARPEHIHLASVRRTLRMATQIDTDPFVDFSYGFITGATADEAVKFVQNIIRASKKKQPERVSVAGTMSGKGTSLAGDTTYVLGSLRLPQRSLRFFAPKDADRDQAFLDEQLPSLQGSGAIMLGGHGMPWEIVHGPRAEDMGKLDLFPAVAFNYACHTGVTLRYPDREWRGAKVHERMKDVERKRSFALNMIRAGVTAYVAYVNPRPAGPEMSTDFQRVLTGASLGESRRADYAKIVLGYLGFGEVAVAAPDWEGERTLDRTQIDAVRHLMLDGATGGILYGDPAFRPYERRADELPLNTVVARSDDDLVIGLTLSKRAVGLWTADPFRKIGKTMARKLYARIALPADAPQIHSVWVESAKVDALPVDTPDPVWALEHDQGQRYLHVKVNYPRSAPWGAPRFVVRASQRASPPQRSKEVLDPETMPLGALVRLTNQTALDAKADVSTLLDALSKRKKPASFDAVVDVIRSGDAHWRTSLLIDATRSPSDETKLMKLADGPPIQNHGRWTALRALGAFDTPEVRAYLLDSLAREHDAGLFMSAAQALSQLREARAAEPISRQLLAFQERWGGVEGHLLSSLMVLGGPSLPDTLQTFATDERATNGWRVLSALQRLATTDGDAARKAATAVRSSARYKAFKDDVRKQIDALARS